MRWLPACVIIVDALAPNKHQDISDNNADHRDYGNAILRITLQVLDKLCSRVRQPASVRCYRRVRLFICSWRQRFMFETRLVCDIKIGLRLMLQRHFKVIRENADRVDNITRRYCTAGSRAKIYKLSIRKSNVTFAGQMPLEMISLQSKYHVSAT